MKNLKSLILLIALSFLSCQPKDKFEQVSVNFELYPFYKDFSKAQDSLSLSFIRENYSQFISGDFEDQFYLDIAQSEDYQSLTASLDSLYPTPLLETRIESTLKAIRYYFPDKKLPQRYYSLIGDGNPEYKIIEQNDEVILNLDQYLGSASNYYQGYAKYLKIQFESYHLELDLIHEILKNEQTSMMSRTFVERMIDYGKWVYINQMLQPNLNVNQLLDYSQEDLMWAESNEYQVWTYFLERELLFSTDTNLTKRFIDPAPFSKFYMDFDNSTPPSIGVFIGYQIVVSFMDNNDVSLSKLLKESSRLVFEQSRYKPKK